MTRDWLWNTHKVISISQLFNMPSGDIALIYAKGANLSSICEAEGIECRIVEGVYIQQEQGWIAPRKGVVIERKDLEKLKKAIIKRQKNPANR